MANPWIQCVQKCRTARRIVGVRVLHVPNQPEFRPIDLHRNRTQQHRIGKIAVRFQQHRHAAPGGRCANRPQPVRQVCRAFVRRADDPVAEYADKLRAQCRGGVQREGAFRQRFRPRGRFRQPGRAVDPAQYRARCTQPLRRRRPMFRPKCGNLIGTQRISDAPQLHRKPRPLRGVGNLVQRPVGTAER